MANSNLSCRHCAPSLSAPTHLALMPRFLKSPCRNRRSVPLVRLGLNTSERLLRPLYDLHARNRSWRFIVSELLERVQGMDSRQTWCTAAVETATRSVSICSVAAFRRRGELVLVRHGDGTGGFVHSRALPEAPCLENGLSKVISMACHEPPAQKTYTLGHKYEEQSHSHCALSKHKNPDSTARE